MESVSRPPHRRKHSSSGNAFSSSFSSKNPYDGVLKSNGGKKKSLEAHEYAEIFSGPSNIPVLDLSDLDERVGSGETRSDSRLDYSNIFGGLSNDDVAVPYQELFSRSAKKATQRIPAEMHPPLQESDSIRSLGKKTKRSSGEVVPDQFADGVKQFNMSFNKTSQINIDASNGKTHIAQLHAVPGFTHFVDGTHQSHKSDERPVGSLKREVSRTWSFSVGFEEVKGRGGSSRDKPNMPDKSPEMNEVNSKTPPPPAQTSNVDPIKNPRQSRASSFASKQKDSEKNTGKCSPPFLEEELDENSAAAVSSAALKKAIEQAEESIRLAKMMMKRKEESLQDGSKPKSKGRSKVRDKKETRADHEGYAMKDDSAEGKYERSDPIFSTVTGVDRNIARGRGQSKPHIHAGKAIEERARENVEAAKEHVTGASETLASSFHEREPSHIATELEFEKPTENKVCNVATDFPGLVANVECETAKFKTVNVGTTDTSITLVVKLTSNVDEKEKIKEIVESKEVIVLQVKEPKVVELVEKATYQRTQEWQKSIDEVTDSCQVKKEPENNVERVLNTAQASPEQVIVDEKNEISNAFRLGELAGERKYVSDDERKHEKKSKECQEVNAENSTLPRSVFDLNKAQILVEKEEQEEVKVKSGNDPLVKGLGGEEADGMSQKVAHVQSCLDNEVQPEDASVEKLNEIESANIAATRGFDNEVDHSYEQEIYEQNHICEGNVGQYVFRRMQDDKIGEIHINASENEATDTKEMEAANFSEFQNSTVVCGTEETERGKQNLNQFEILEVSSERNMNDPIVENVSDAVFGETQSNDVGIREKRYQRAAESCENVGVSGDPETYSATCRDMEIEGLFHFEDNEIPETCCLRRNASEETFTGIKLDDIFEDFSSDGKKQDAGVMEVGDRENLPKDEVDVSILNDDGEAHAAKIRGDPSNIETAEISTADVAQVWKQASGNNQASASSSSSPLESMAGSSSDESERAENDNERVPDKEEVKHDLKMPSKEREYVEGQSETVYPEDRSGGAYSKEPEKVVESSQNMEVKTNLTGSSTMEEKDAKQNVSNFEKNDHQQRIEAIKRGREWEKDRIAVERAIREARERAFAEARERAERAAVEKAAAEVRQRIMAEAREKLEKQAACSMASKQPSDKQATASTEARVRAERAAVERATAEARERALEKAMSQKTSTEVRTHGDRHISESGSSSSRNSSLKHSYSSSDLEKLDGANTESAQRRKARLERHQRIMERAAKALEEKNMRDLRVLKEQDERNRLAESLDADIKRWVAGKEGNLRALLSTLQYILGAESGWQPISLTEIISTAAVKKAYRKATLYVHPDKLQQRGASIQQKYICEKVFDLLKAAWNRFNSEER